MVPTSAIVALVSSLLIASLYTPLDANPTFVSQAVKEPYVEAKNLLLVTAHPDDEAMFFAPTILALSQMASDGKIGFFHVCMSTGNAVGLGAAREKELGYSLDILGIPQQRRWIVDHPELQDNITADWDPNVVAKVLKPYVTELKIDTILTFDSRGISDHPNHIALFAGAETLITSLGETSSKPPPRLFTLFSVPLFTKYTSFFTVFLGKVDLYVYFFMDGLSEKIILLMSYWYPDILTPEIPRHTAAGSMPVFIAGYKEYSTELLAMQAHASQMEWFRYLYVAFSRYMWSNAWTHVRINGTTLA